MDGEKEQTTHQEATVMTSEQIVSYVLRYGGNCRDCADADGICPNTDMPCGFELKTAVIKHTLTALEYGISHGFIADPFTRPAPAATDTGLVTVVDRYHKKSFEVEAIQYTGENLEQVLAFTGKHPSWDSWFKSFDDYFKHVSSDGFKFKVIGGPYGTEIAVPGDWIIKRDGGRAIVCKPLTFADQFEPLFTRSQAEKLLAVERAENTRLQSENDAQADQISELQMTPWPEWATKVLAVIRKRSGYGGYGDAIEGVDLPAELDECIAAIEADNAAKDARIKELEDILRDHRTNINGAISS